jgi:hypothetical protein
VTTFLSTLSDKLAQRWGTLLLPGALFAAAVVCAALLGHGHALDLTLLGQELTRIAQRHSTGAEVALAALELLLAAGAAGWAAQAAGQVVRSVWLGRWRGPAAPLARVLAEARKRRARKAAEAAGVQPVLAYLPQRPTVIGERFRLLDARVAGQYQDLRLALVWPRLWVLLPESSRAPVQSANGQWRAAAVLSGWGCLYVILGCWWFPAAVIGVAAGVLGWRHGRAHGGTLVTLIEATLDTNLDLLTTALGIPLPQHGLAAETAGTINDRLQKGG